MSLADKIYFLLLLLTLASYLVKLNRQEKFIRWITILLSFWLVATLAAVLLPLNGVIRNNLFIYHIITPVEFTLILLLYRSYFENTVIKRILIYSIPIFILLCIVFSLFVQKTDVSNSYTSIIESAVIISVSLLFLKETAQLQRVKSLVHYPMFWISVAILFGYTAPLIIEGMLNYLIDQSMKLAQQLYLISYFSNYILLILFMIAIFCDRRPYTNINKPVIKSPVHGKQ